VLSLILWWSGLALEIVILVRGLQTRAISKYPYFYVYILCVFGVSTGLYASYRVSPTIYSQWYWRTQFATLLVGCGVILEILENALESYAGARRFLSGLCATILAAVVGYAALKVSLGAVRFTPVTEAGMERDLRTVQAVFLATILAVVSYYGIGLGKNLRGLILGFGAYVGVSLMTLAVLSVRGHRFENISGPLQSGSYLFALAVWTVALWSYAPNPAADPFGRIEPDYDQLAGETRRKLEALRDYFKSPERP
jgi:hypothetical protein